MSGIMERVQLSARRAIYAGSDWRGIKVLRVYEGRSYFLNTSMLADCH